VYVGGLKITFVKKVGDGENTFFWDKWLRVKLFITVFLVFFELSVDKNISVADKWRSKWGVRGSGWSWRRSLFAWEEELSLECCTRQMDFAT
jgi:hypothetical protein